MAVNTDNIHNDLQNDLQNDDQQATQLTPQQSQQIQVCCVIIGNSLFR